LIFIGNGGTVDTNGIAWEFLSQFSKSDTQGSVYFGPLKALYF